MWTGSQNPTTIEKAEYACAVFLKWFTEKERSIDLMEVAVSETESYQLYAANPFEKSAEAREFLGTYIQHTAQEAHDEAALRIEESESREESRIWPKT